VHVQSGAGAEHRTIVISARRARLLRALWSKWGAALLLAVAGSWVYFAVQSARLPVLASRIAELEAERTRIDSLQATLHSLQLQYEQVTRMLGAARSPDDSGTRTARPPQED
jgi:hypothetical protein